MTESHRDGSLWSPRGWGEIRGFREQIQKPWQRWGVVQTTHLRPLAMNGGGGPARPSEQRCLRLCSQPVLGGPVPRLHFPRVQCPSPAPTLGPGPSDKQALLGHLEMHLLKAWVLLFLHVVGLFSGAVVMGSGSRNTNNRECGCLQRGCSLGARCPPAPRSCGRCGRQRGLSCHLGSFCVHR